MDPTKKRKEPVEGNIIIKITIGKNHTGWGKKKKKDLFIQIESAQAGLISVAEGWR